MTEEADLAPAHPPANTVLAARYGSAREAFDHALVILAMNLPYWHVHQSGSHELYVEEEPNIGVFELHVDLRKEFPGISNWLSTRSLAIESNGIVWIGDQGAGLFRIEDRIASRFLESSMTEVIISPGSPFCVV